MRRKILTQISYIGTLPNRSEQSTQTPLAASSIRRYYYGVKSKRIWLLASFPFRKRDLSW